MVPSLREALDILSRKPIAVVFCEHKLVDGGFREILGENAKLVRGVPVVV